MRILAVDVGTGTQDILLFDSEQELENSVKMVMPSPTLVVAVFDHGAAPPGYSDRIFRFEYLAERVRERNSLTSFAYLREEIPASLTRLAAAASSAPSDLPLLAMDTAPAAVLGALEDPQVWSRPRAIVANVGNFHCLAFRLEDGRIAGLFEHHSGELTSQKLRRYVEKLAAGTITNDEVYRDMGHGALVFEPSLPPFSLGRGFPRNP